MNWAAQNLKCASVVSALYKLVLSAVVYHVCGERNARIFSNRSRDQETVFRGIYIETLEIDAAPGRRRRILILKVGQMVVFPCCPRFRFWFCFCWVLGFSLLFSGISPCICMV